MLMKLTNSEALIEQSNGKRPESVPAVRITRSFLTVLEIFTSRPKDWINGYEIMELTGIFSGTVYPLLSRMKERGWLESEVEKIDTSLGRTQRHPRVFYRITQGGIREGHKLLESRTERLDDYRITPDSAAVAG